MIFMNFKMVHEKYNVQDLDNSVNFYAKALGLSEKRRKTAPDSSFILAYLGNDTSDFELELIWLADPVGKYDLGMRNFTLCFMLMILLLIMSFMKK